MPTAIEFIADRLPRVTVEDVRRSRIPSNPQCPGFAAELQAFIHERVEAVKLPANLEGETVVQALQRKAAALRSDTRWAPNEPMSSEAAPCCWKPSTSRTICRLPSSPSWRTSRASNLQGHPRPSAAGTERGAARPEAARLAARPGEAAVDPTVLQEVEGIDHWTIYRALSEPLEGLGGRSPVDAVTHGTIDDVAEAVFNVLGVQVH